MTTPTIPHLVPGHPMDRPGFTFTREQTEALNAANMPQAANGDKSSLLRPEFIAACFLPNGAVTKHAALVLNPLTALGDPKVQSILDGTYVGAPVAFILSADGGILNYHGCASGPNLGEFIEPDPSEYLLAVVDEPHPLDAAPVGNVSTVQPDGMVTHSTGSGGFPSWTDNPNLTPGTTITKTEAGTVISVPASAPDQPPLVSPPHHNFRSALAWVIRELQKAGRWVEKEI